MVKSLILARLIAVLCIAATNPLQSQERYRRPVMISNDPSSSLHNLEESLQFSVSLGYSPAFNFRLPTGFNGYELAGSLNSSSVIVGAAFGQTYGDFSETRSNNNLTRAFYRHLTSYSALLGYRTSTKRWDYYFLSSVSLLTTESRRERSEYFPESWWRPEHWEWRTESGESDESIGGSFTIHAGRLSESPFGIAASASFHFSRFAVFLTVGIMGVYSFEL